MENNTQILEGKICSNCEKFKEFNEFPLVKKKSGIKYYCYCKSCKKLKDSEGHYRRKNNIPLARESIIDLPNEIWVNITGYENLYQVSNMGRVKSLDCSDRKNQSKISRLLKPTINGFGSYYVTLSRNKKPKKLLVFQLVARHFIKDVKSYRCFKHKNGDLLDNRVENIEYNTRDEKISEGLKTCETCKKEQNLNNFYICSTGWINSRCKKCEIKNRKEYYNQNREIISEKGKIYHVKNKDIKLAKHKVYYEKNKKEINRKNHEANKEREKTDIPYRLRKRYKNLLHSALKKQGFSKNGRSCKDFIGCSFEDFKKHIEAQFESWMNWDNYGKEGWHLGHIQPCELFDLSDEKQVKSCFHFFNIKPQFWRDNISRQDFLPDGRRARDLTNEQKLEYLKSVGITF